VLLAPHPVIFVSVCSVRKLEWWSYQAEKKFEVIFRCFKLDREHE